VSWIAGRVCTKSSLILLSLQLDKRVGNMKILYKTFQPLHSRNHEKSVSVEITDTLQRLIDEICSQEGRPANETAYLYLLSGIPLNYNPVSVNYPVKNWYLKESDCLFVLFAPKQVCAESYGQQCGKCISQPKGTMGVKVLVSGDRQCILQCFGNESIRELHEKVSQKTGIPLEWLKLYHPCHAIDPTDETKKIADMCNDNLEQIEVTIRVEHKRKLYDAFSSKLIQPRVNQTDKGIRMFYSFLFVVAFYITKGSLDLRLLAFIYQITDCPPLIHALASIFDNRIIAYAQRVAIQEGLFELFRLIRHECMPSFIKEQPEDATVFECSEECWKRLLCFSSKLPITDLPVAFQHMRIVQFQCSKCKLQMCAPCSRMGTDVLCALCADSHNDLDIDEFTSQLILALPLENEAALWDLPPNNYGTQLLFKNLSVEASWKPSFIAIHSIQDLRSDPCKCKPPSLTHNAQYHVIVFTGRSGKVGTNKTHYLFDPLTGEDRLEDINLIDFYQHVEQFKTSMHTKMFITQAPDELIVILLDISSSMNRKTLQHNTTRLQMACNFFAAFMKRTCSYNFKHAIALTYFNDNTHKKCLFSESVEALASVLINESQSIKACGNTHLWDAVLEAMDQLQCSNLPKECHASAKRILCLTDGSDWGSKHKAIDCVKKLSHDNIVLDAILIGTESSETKAVSYASGGFPFHFKNASDAMCIAEAEHLLSLRRRHTVDRGSSTDDSKAMLKRYKIWPYAILITKNPPPLLVKTANVANCHESAIHSEICNYLEFKNPCIKDTEVRRPIAAINAAKSNGEHQGERARRLLQELTYIAKNGTPAPPGGSIEVYPLKSCIDRWKGYMQCPADSPYVKRLVFSMNFPPEYPKCPPELRFETPILHPNVSSEGRMFHYLLQKQHYSQELTIGEILKQILICLLLPMWKTGADSIRSETYYKSQEAFNEEAKKRSQSVTPENLQIEGSDSDYEIPEDDEAWFLQK
jgi:ubiquitin-protein ligase